MNHYHRTALLNIIGKYKKVLIGHMKCLFEGAIRYSKIEFRSNSSTCSYIYNPCQHTAIADANAFDCKCLLQTLPT